MNVIVPVGTKKNTVVGLSGVPLVICYSDPELCREANPLPDRFQYYDDQLNPTDDYCGAFAIGLEAKPHCCDDPICVLIPDGIAGQDPYTPLFTEEYANDGTAIPDLALAGTIYAGYVAESNQGIGEYDRLTPTPPAGYAYEWLVVASPHDAIAYTG